MSQAQTRLLLAALVAAIAVWTLALDGLGALASKLPQLGRSLVAGLGLLGALLLVTEKTIGTIDGWRLALVWAIIQIPIFAWSPDGSPNVQALVANLGVNHETKVNNQITSYGQYGLNIVGLLLAWGIRHFSPRRL
ncbi:MAG: hypothetical protein ACKVP7_29260 [Hyphomicrobiaceae bacterium]